METNIRKLKVADAGPYQELIRKAYADTRRYGINFRASDADFADICAHLRTNNAYGLEKEGALVATLSIRYPWGDSPGPLGLPHLGWFATDPCYKRQGYGSRLFRYVEESFLEGVLKLPAVTLGTAANHPWLADVYGSFGFRELETVQGPDHLIAYFIKIYDEKKYRSWRQGEKA